MHTMIKSILSKGYLRPFSKGILSFLKWMLICLLVACPVALACAFFLYSLELATQSKEQHPWFLYLLPIGGLLIGLLYYYKGTIVNKGNNLLIEDYHKATNTIPLKMGVFVLLGTLTTHLFGGSAGREGTALQIGASISEQFSKIFTLSPKGKKLLILLGISAGFSAVFGTPLAGALFAMEIMIVGKLQYKGAFYIFVCAYLADYICTLTGITHSTYSVTNFLNYNAVNTLWIIICAVVFGITSIVFVFTTDLVSKTLKKYVSPIYMHPFYGALIFIGIITLLNQDIYLGLGIPTIQQAFLLPSAPYVFFIKLVLTALILGSGFKGGEVTPLFFIGATLGSALAYYLNMPLDVFASIGFVAVFCGATKTPLACIAMALELFGYQNGIYTALACVIAYLISGRHTIYKSQKFNLENSTIK